MDILLPFFQLLYFIAHFVVSLFQASYEIYQDIIQFIGRLLQGYKDSPPDHVLRSHADILKKKPKHLAFLLMRNQVWFLNNLAVAMKWSSGYDVNFISIYDTQGILKQKWHILNEKLSSLCPNVAFKQVRTVLTKPIVGFKK